MWRTCSKTTNGLSLSSGMFQVWGLGVRGCVPGFGVQRLEHNDPRLTRFRFWVSGFGARVKAQDTIFQDLRVACASASERRGNNFPETQRRNLALTISHVSSSLDGGATGGFNASIFGSQGSGLRIQGSWFRVHG